MAIRHSEPRPPEFRLHPLGEPEADASPGDYVALHDDSQTLVYGVVLSISAGGIARVRLFGTDRLITCSERRLRPLAEEHSVVDAYFDPRKGVTQQINEEALRQRELQRRRSRLWP